MRVSAHRRRRFQAHATPSLHQPRATGGGWHSGDAGDARGKPQRTWSVFAAGSIVVFTLNVLGNAFFHFRISGEPLRQVPELDLVFILGAVTVLAWLWEQPRQALRIAAVVVTLAAFYTTIGYVRHA